MLKLLEKIWPVVSLLLVLAVLGSLFFLPAYTRPLALAVLVLGVGMALLFTLRRPLDDHRRGRIDRRTLIRRLATDVPGLLLALALSIPAGAWSGQAAGGWAARAVEVRWPGWGLAAGMAAGMLAAVLVGIAAGLLVRWGWGRLLKEKKTAPAEA